ncbi:hypothetical protein Tco_1456422 [Tanacetum coccineum]
MKPLKIQNPTKSTMPFALGAEPPKTKPSVKKKQVETDKAQTPQATKGKRLKTTAKVTKPSMKKQPTQGLETLSEVALTEEEQMRIVTKRSLTEYHSSHASRLGADKGTGVTPGVPDVPKYGSDDEQISWKSSSDEDDDAESKNDYDNDDADNQDDDEQEYDEHDDEEQGDDDEQTDSDNDGDDFVHPKFSTHDEEDKEKDSFDPRVQTPSHVESTDDEDSDEEIQDANVEGDMMNKEETNEEAEVDAITGDVIVSWREDILKCSIRSTTEFFCVIWLHFKHAQPSLDTGIDPLFNLNTELTLLVDVLVTTVAEPPLLSPTTLPPPPTPLITHLQQTPVPTPPTVPSSSLQDLPNFGSLFRFYHRLKTLENNFLEFNQTNQFAAAVSLIPGIVDAYLANKMHEAVKTAVHLQSERLRDEAQAENANFLNKLDDNIKKIIKDQLKEQVKAQVSMILPKIKKTVNEQLEAEVMTHSSNESKTSHAVAANLFELELKKILIDKMESNMSIHRSDEQRNLYKALVDAYESDKLILDTYRDNVSFKRHTNDEDKDEEPSARSNQGSKRRRAGKELESTSAPKEKTSKTIGKSTEGSKSHHKSAGESTQAEEPMHTAKDLEEPTHQEFETGVTEDQPNKETFQHPNWFQKLAEPPTPNHD